MQLKGSGIKLKEGLWKEVNPKKQKQNNESSKLKLGVDIIEGYHCAPMSAKQDWDSWSWSCLAFRVAHNGVVTRKNKKV